MGGRRCWVFGGVISESRIMPEILTRSRTLSTNSRDRQCSKLLVPTVACFGAGLSGGAVEGISIRVLLPSLYNCVQVWRDDLFALGLFCSVYIPCVSSMVHRVADTAI